MLLTRTPREGLTATSQSERVAFENSCARFLRGFGPGMLDEARASQLQRMGAGARHGWSCLNAPQRVLSFLPCHLAQEHNMGWKCVEMAYHSDCPLPSPCPLAET